jgi:hypothetical protein
MRAAERVFWTDEERQQLRRLHANGLTLSQIGKLMGRSKNSIHRQLANLGVIRNDRNSVPVQSAPGRPTHRPPKTTLPTLPSLATDIDAKPWDGTGWPRDEDWWP